MSNMTLDFRMHKSSGIGTYLTNMLSYIGNYPFDKINLLIDKKTEKKIYCRENFNYIDFSSKIYSVSEQIQFRKKIPPDTDIFWSPHYNVPLLYRGKLIVTVHDVFHLAMPEYVEGIHKKKYAKLMFYAVLKKASAIICVSEFTANEFKKYVGNNDKINIVHNGVNKTWFNVKKKKHPHRKPYLLYVGNVKPHKNLITLIKAFNLIANEITHDILIVGKKEGFITCDRSVFCEAKKLGGRVCFTGYVDDDLLKQYFVYADALIFPSLYEGFGLPPLEAMACGCPVIVSNRASLPEVCGDAALYCDPTSPEDIAAKIKLLLEDNALRETLRKKGLARARMFSWEKCARETWAVIEKVLAL